MSDTASRPVEFGGDQRSDFLFPRLPVTENKPDHPDIKIVTEHCRRTISCLIEFGEDIDKSSFPSAGPRAESTDPPQQSKVSLTSETRFAEDDACCA